MFYYLIIRQISPKTGECRAAFHGIYSSLKKALEASDKASIELGKKGWVGWHCLKKVEINEFVNVEILP